MCHPDCFPPLLVLVVGTEVVRVAHVLSPRVAHIFYIYFGVFFTIGDRTCAPLPELLSLAGRPKPPFLNDAMAGSCHRSSGSPTWGMPTPEEVISVIYFGRYRRLQIRDLQHRRRREQEGDHRGSEAVAPDPKIGWRSLLQAAAWPSFDSLRSVCPSVMHLPRANRNPELRTARVAHTPIDKKSLAATPGSRPPMKPNNLNRKTK